MANRHRQRSRSRSPPLGTKLHVRCLSLNYMQETLNADFARYGRILDVKIIRKGNNGQPLKESLYGFVVMESTASAETAMNELNAQGWNVSFSKETLQRLPLSYSFPVEKEQEKPAEIIPTDKSFIDNLQATNVMLLSNAKPSPGHPMDSGVLRRLLCEHQPNSLNLVSVPLQYQNYFIVREIWIGNISPATDKKFLYDAFKGYGEIEGIEMFSSKGFAFIKYRKVLTATLAYERADGVFVDNRQVKVAFADPTRRIDIVGDSAVLANPCFNPIDDEHFKNLFLGYSPGTEVPSEPKLREVFSRYGRVKRISIRQATPTTRPYAFVDFDKGDQASEARTKLYIEDRDGQRRRELGDWNLEISFKNTNNIVSKTGVKNGQRSQDRASLEAATELERKLLEQPLAFVNLLKFQPLLSGLSPVLPRTEFTVNSSCAQVVEQSSPKEEGDLQLSSVIWSGFITRSKAHRVGIDATLVKGNSDCFPETQYHINISHRVHLKDVHLYKVYSLVLLEASNETQQQLFNEYVEYFRSKERAGYIAIRTLILYVCPPLPGIRQLYPVPDGALLGVFVDKTQKNQQQESKPLLQNPDPRLANRK